MEKDLPETFTNRELYLLIKSNNDTNLLQHQSILQSLKDFHCTTKETLERIEIQTTKHNGRMKSLENSRIQIWTAIAVGIVFMGALITLSKIAIDSQIRDGIKTGIAEALEDFELYDTKK